MPLGRKVDGGSNYKCSDFEDRERILERITMNITFEHHGRVQNENRKIFMISLGTTTGVLLYIYVDDVISTYFYSESTLILVLVNNSTSHCACATCYVLASTNLVKQLLMLWQLAIKN